MRNAFWLLGLWLIAGSVPAVEREFDLPYTWGTVCLAFDKYARSQDIDHDYDCTAIDSTAALITVQIATVYEVVTRTTPKTCEGERPKGILGRLTGEMEQYEYQCPEEYEERVTIEGRRLLRARLTDFSDELELSGSVTAQKLKQLCDGGKCVPSGDWEDASTHELVANVGDRRSEDFSIEDNDLIRVVVNTETVQSANLEALLEAERRAEEERQAAVRLEAERSARETAERERLAEEQRQREDAEEARRAAQRKRFADVQDLVHRNLYAEFFNDCVYGLTSQESLIDSCRGRASLALQRVEGRLQIEGWSTTSSAPRIPYDGYIIDEPWRSRHISEVERILEQGCSAVSDREALPELCGTQ